MPLLMAPKETVLVLIQLTPQTVPQVTPPLMAPKETVLAPIQLTPQMELLEATTLKVTLAVAQEIKTIVISLLAPVLT